MAEKFKPKFDLPDLNGARFQVPNLNISGELGEKCIRAARKYGLKNAKFVEAALQYAIDNMEQD